MGIVSMGREPGYPKTSEKFEGKRVNVTHRDRLKIQVDSESLLGEDLLNQIPYLIGDYFANGTARLISRELDRSAENRLLWFLDLGYDQKFDDQKEEEKNKPPDERTPEWSWDFETIDLAFLKDVDNGNPVCNAVGEPIELTDEYVIPILHIERHKQTFDSDEILDYVNRRNTTAFWGAPAGTAVMGGIRDKKDEGEVFQGKAYRKVGYTIKFKIPFIADVVEGWKEIILNHGTFYIDVNTGNPRSFADDFNNQITGNLTAFGTKAAAGELNYLKFNKKKEAEFNDLKLGPTAWF